MNVTGCPLKMTRSIWSLILVWSLTVTTTFSQAPTSFIRFDFYGNAIELPFDGKSFTDFTEPLSEKAIQSFYDRISITNYQPVIQQLKAFKEQLKLDDWLYYQLIRKTAQTISPKAENYFRYTLYKWFFLSRSGYDATLTIAGNRILFYVQSDENIYNIPYRLKDGKQYVCLNYHDYGSIDFEKDHFTEVKLPTAEIQKSFSYKITQLPDFKANAYLEKDLQFNYYENNYHFKIKLNPQLKTIFANYPVVDYESYFNIPLSWETYTSLIPLLKENLKGLSPKNGVDYLMRFTRYAFIFETDTKNFGNEKRLSPELTLMNENSDCEDRAALFFYLVKEIYKLPMIVLSFEKHVTIAIEFDKPVGHPIIYNGKKYSVCEPTPQKRDLVLGQLIPELRNSSYEVAYVYDPYKK